MTLIKVKGGDTALNGTPISKLRSITCCMNHTVDLSGWLHTEMVYLPTGSHPSQY